MWKSESLDDIVSSILWESKYVKKNDILDKTQQTQKI